MSTATVTPNNNNPASATNNNKNSIPSTNNNNNTNSNNINNNNNNNISNSKANLIVNYLPQSIKEHDFCQLFAKIGPIKTCKLMYDKQTGYSFGYGFVDYQNIEDAARAIESLNGFQIEHKRLKVAFARPNCEDTKNTNLYIRNLPTTYDENNLNDLFSQYGEVVQVRILRDPVTNFSRRIGFVIMSTKPMAQSAIENLDNQIPPNGTEPIHVKYADEEGKNKKTSKNGHHNNHHNYHNNNNNNYHHHHNNNNNSNNNNNHHHNVFHTSNSHHSTISSNGLQNLGKMKSNRGNGHNRYNPMSTNYGYAYSNFTQSGSSNFDGLINGFQNNFMNQTQNGHHGHQNHHHVSGSGGHHNSHHHYNNSNNNNNNNNNNNTNSHHNHHGQSNRHNQHHHHHHHQQQQQQQQHGASGSLVNGLLNFDNNGQLNSGEKGGYIIYVYGIGPQASESDLYTLFQSIGSILRVNVIKNQKTGLGKGYGFVVFERYEEALYAVQHMNGFIYNNRPLQVQINDCQIET